MQVSYSPDRSPWFWFLVLGPLALTMFFAFGLMLKAHWADEAKARTCLLGRSGDLEWVTGTVRRVGQTLFLLSNQRWRPLVSLCQGKAATQCLEANGGFRRRLQGTLGGTLEVAYCADVPVMVKINDGIWWLPLSGYSGIVAR